MAYYLGILCDMLLFNTYVTMGEAVLGFVCGSFAGFIVAVLFAYSKSAKGALYPYAIAAKAMPVFALAPLLVVWFGTGIWSKVVMAALVCFFPVLVSSYKGLSSVDRDYLDLFRSFGSSGKEIFLKLRVPSSLPYLFPALKVAAGAAVIGATVAEFTGASNGIGHMVVNASYYLDTSLMFAAIVFISLGGILFFYLIDFAEKHIVFWQKEE